MIASNFTIRSVAATLSLVLLAAATPALVLAQQLDTAVARALSRIQNGVYESGSSPLARRTLRAQGSAQERANAEILADSLMAMVIDTVSHRLTPKARIGIMIDLGSAGSNDPRGEAVFDGAKYRLARIAYEAPAARDRAMAVSQLIFIADSLFALDILKRVALSDDENTAYIAVMRLWDGMENKGGIAVLKELWESGGVKSPLARRSLYALAREYGWK